jgi:nucleoside-diphosphate-sugar epimerase
LELMRELHVPKGVYTSTLAINSNTNGQVVDESYFYGGRHLSEYDRTKWEAHHQVAIPMIRQGLPLVIVMPGLVYGTGDNSTLRQTFIQYLQRKLPLMPQKTAFAWGHVDDIAQGYILAMEKGRPGETYMLAGPVHTLVEALQTAEQITGIPLPKLKASPALMKLLSRIMSLVERVVPVPETLASETLRVSAGVTYIGSNAKAREELGFHPRSLREGLRQWLEDEMKLVKEERSRK